MDLQYSNVKQLWYNQEPQFLRKLKYIDLSHSLQLTETPDFWYLPNLEKLLLINCKKLVLVHKTIRILNRKLVLLNFKGCTELRDLPVELYTLKSLETLILSGCSQLERLDDALGGLESLTTLKADFTALRKIPSSSNQLKKLKELSLDGCKDLWKDRDFTRSDESPQESLPTTLSLTGLTCLVTLSLGSCNLSDELIPEDLGSLSCLEELSLQGNNFRNLQTDFAGLWSLQILKLDSCSELESMFSLPKKLRSFYASNCIMLERTPDLSGCLGLQSLHLTNCFNLVETPGLDTLKRVGVIHMEMCKRISDTYRERIMQRWAVDGNGGIFVPGSSLPNWVSFKNEKHSISFTVPKSLNPDLVGFTLWTPYVSQQNDMLSAYSSRITLKNQTNGDIWSLNPATDHIRMYREKHIWQGHFSNDEYNLQTGDQVEVSVDFGDQIAILETGLCLAYREEDTDSSDSDTSEVGHDEIIDEQLILREAGGDDEELVMEETQSRPRRKMGMGLKTLVGAFGLLTMTVIAVLGKRNILLSRQNRLRSIEGGKNEKDVRLKFFSRQGF
ncbi:disease resistance protein RPV1-like [Raphanus sativus]|uniref:Disease resistance protein RPV1-like n=1 Tax=Raphanus sativus TaxID=3726 RepID=A0A6J0M322_RAPSA|nr:disease resistance protein RPV1-like [Raphanus sativus]